MADEIVLELKDLEAGYGDITVLRDISISVPRSSVAVLLGPNGAGKTTLLRAASGLLKPSAGTVRVNGHEMTGSPPFRWLKAGLCHVPEGRGIFRSLSVRENLELAVPPWLNGSSYAAATDVFPVLKRRLDQIANTLSGGEQQMLALARCYLARPSVALLDEVSMGLAPKVVAEILESIRGLVERGVTLVVAEQYVRQALAMADAVYVIKRGRVVFGGDPSELDEHKIERLYLS
jgi:branched-chain amino acid transport system ATP-binding protein